MTARLHDFLRDWRSRPFRYGVTDCALFAAAWVQAATGRDLTLGIRYSTRRDGLAQLKARGFADPLALLAASLPEIPPLHARAGDLALVGPAIGVVTGETVAVLTRTGLGLRPLTDARRAFRVSA